MSNADVNFVLEIIEEVKRSGRAFSRDVLRDCYFEDLQKRGASEKPLVSEKWIDYYWQRLNSVPFDQIVSTASSIPKLAKLLAELLGK